MNAILVAGLWVVLSLIVCAIATQKGKNPVVWFLSSLCLSPALGWIVARRLEERQPAGVIALLPCPYCGAPTAQNAEACLRCHAEFPDGAARKLAA